jgi:hypothetical protein
MNFESLNKYLRITSYNQKRKKLYRARPAFGPWLTVLQVHNLLSVTGRISHGPDVQPT